MSRNPSAAFKRAVFAAQTGEAILLLLAIDHPTLTAPLRVTSDAVDTTSGGNTFVAYPFQITLAEESEDATPSIALTIDNVDRTIGAALRDAGLVAPTCTIQVVMGSDPDTIEAEFPAFSLRDVDYDALTVTCQLTLEDMTTLPYPYLTFTPNRFPGLFK